MIFNNVYKNSKVLVTGHTGFKGSWLAIWLKELGADVIGYALEPPGSPNNFTVCSLNKKIKHIHGDILDYKLLQEVFDKYQPEFVFHLAAQAVVRASYANPKLTLDTNIGGTINVLEAVRCTPNVRALVCVTSDKCYDNKGWIWGYRENDQLGGHDPYSASKGCAELVCTAYRKSFFNPQVQDKVGFATARAGNTVGGGDWGQDRIIPDIVRSLSAKQSIKVRNPLSIRPWQHALDCISGYLWLGALLKQYPNDYSEAWNFGPTDQGYYSVKDIVAKFIDIWGCGDWKDISGQGDLPEASLLYLCCDKARVKLGWESVLDIDETIKWTAEWYKNYYQGGEQDIYVNCLNQIQTYVKKAKDRQLSWTRPDFENL